MVSEIRLPSSLLGRPQSSNRHYFLDPCCNDDLYSRVKNIHRCKVISQAPAKWRQVFSQSEEVSEIRPASYIKRKFSTVHAENSGDPCISTRKA